MATSGVALPAAAILGQALAEHPLKQPDVVLERWQQRLALLPAKRLPVLATALQEPPQISGANAVIRPIIGGSTAARHRSSQS